MKHDSYYYKLERPIPELDAMREKLARDTAAFLAGGGKIQQLPRGATKYGAISDHDIRAKLDKNKLEDEDEV